DSIQIESPELAFTGVRGRLTVHGGEGPDWPKLPRRLAEIPEGWFVDLEIAVDQTAVEDLQIESATVDLLLERDGRLSGGWGLSHLKWQEPWGLESLKGDFQITKQSELELQQ